MLKLITLFLCLVGLTAYAANFRVIVEAPFDDSSGFSKKAVFNFKKGELKPIPLPGQNWNCTAVVEQDSESADHLSFVGIAHLLCFNQAAGRLDIPVVCMNMPKLSNDRHAEHAQTIFQFSNAQEPTINNTKAVTVQCSKAEFSDPIRP